MTAYQSQLKVDFGDVGYGNSKQPFRVRIDAAALTALIPDAGNAHRVYELMLIDRPGDASSRSRPSTGCSTGALTIPGPKTRLG